MVDAPLGTSNPEGSDMGPGLTDPDELPSHKWDSAHESGHNGIVSGHNGICAPAPPSSNQCAALFLDDHGIQFHLDLDGLCVCTFAAMGKGLIAPTLLQSKTVASLALFDMTPADNKFLHGVWTVMTFDFAWGLMDFVFAFANLTVGCDGQGTAHPDSVPVQDSQFVTEFHHKCFFVS